MADRIAVETDTSKLVSVGAASTLSLTMFSVLGASIGPQVYENNKSLIHFAVEQNSVLLSTAVGAIVVTNSCVAAVGIGGIAEAHSLARDVHQRLRELHFPSQ